MDRRSFLAGAASIAVCSSNVGDAEALQGDIDILEAAYTALHPGLYRYATPHQVAERFRTLKREFAHAASLQARYLKLSRFLATIRCGHTYANFYNQSSAVKTALFDGGGRLPFHFRWLNGRMVVTRNQSSNPQLAPGVEIVRIDGRSPASILRTLLAYARADGGNDAKRRALLEVAGADRYETFDVFYGLTYPVSENGFDLEIIPPETRVVRRLRVPAIDLAARRAGMTAALDGDRTAPQWTLDERSGVAILTMPNWALYDSEWNWRAFLDTTFASIEHARGLIVDLRGNEGGLDCGNEILACLIDSDLALSDDERRVRFRTTPAALNAYLDTWDHSFQTLGQDATDLGNGFYRLPPEEGVSSIRPKGPRFRAPVVVLTDAQNSSATFQFAQIVQSRRLGKLVGAPTGGNQRGINGGAFFFLRLPASGLEADLPLIGRFPLSPKPDAGLSPDTHVEDTAEDIAAGRDRVLQAALQMFD